MEAFDVNVPDGTSGNWRVESFEVSEHEARMTAIRAHYSFEYVPPGKYKRLTYCGQVIMSNTPMELRSNMPIVRAARGDVHINGLGLGMVVAACLRKPEVTSVTVVENSEDVIRLVTPTFAAEPRFTIIHGDAFTYTPARGARYAAVWHDIWADICVDNLGEMSRLHRRWGRWCDWQGSWSREMCQMVKKRESRGYRRYR